MFYDVKRYDIKGKHYLGTVDKYYLNDPGIRKDAFEQSMPEFKRFNIVEIG